MILFDILNKDNITIDDFYFLIKQKENVDLIFSAAKRKTLKYFGKTIQLYAPLYVSNECVNSCRYCGFNAKSGIKRATLTLEQVAKEAKYLAKQGFQHILLVSGESREKSPVDYLREVIVNLKKTFVSVSIEIYPISKEEYSILIDAGVDGLALYQETYHLPTYNYVHPSGPKKNFSYRYGSYARAAEAGMRRIGLGVLLGLYDWRYEAIEMAKHLKYLMRKYWQTQFQLSFPRINPAETNFKVKYPVSDEDLVLKICAFRLLFPQMPFTLSTREHPDFRERIFPFGITSMSAGSKTSPGGYVVDRNGGKQFDVSDKRSVKEVLKSLIRSGYEPVFKDWERDFI